MGSGRRFKGFSFSGMIDQVCEIRTARCPKQVIRANQSGFSAGNSLLIVGDAEGGKDKEDAGD
jgi:hypothetical protein